MNFGQRLREFRENKRITQKELSKILNVSESAIGMYERGEREPNFETVDKIASLFNTDADYLLGRTNRPKPDLAAQLISAANKAKQGEGVKEMSADNEIYIAYLGGPPKELDEEEAEHLDRELEMFRAFREKKQKERDQRDK